MRQCGVTPTRRSAGERIPDPDASDYLRVAEIFRSTSHPSSTAACTIIASRKFNPACFFSAMARRTSSATGANTVQAPELAHTIGSFLDR
jgi:hypothetical protein